AWLDTAYLRGVFARGAHLDHARLDEAHLEAATLGDAHLVAARLITAHLQGANLLRAHLEGANLTGDFMDGGTYLRGVRLSSPEHGAAFLVNVVWGGANLSEVDWSQVKVLAEERGARHPNRAPLPSLPELLFTALRPKGPWL
ncbi:MAG TPA: pentapeptide repeat-containing protein, partial [Ktedonobacterales bacterium]|nr:pentapeptide repeat-containing protein [Ktedonobacterales bacterium]